MSVEIHSETSERDHRGPRLRVLGVFHHRRRAGRRGVRVALRASNARRRLVRCHRLSSRRLDFGLGRRLFHAFQRVEDSTLEFGWVVARRVRIVHLRFRRDGRHALREAHRNGRDDHEDGDEATDQDSTLAVHKGGHEGTHDDGKADFPKYEPRHVVPCEESEEASTRIPRVGSVHGHDAEQFADTETQVHIQSNPGHKLHEAEQGFELVLQPLVHDVPEVQRAHEHNQADDRGPQHNLEEDRKRDRSEPERAEARSIVDRASSAGGGRRGSGCRCCCRRRGC